MIWLQIIFLITLSIPLTWFNLVLFYKSTILHFLLLYCWNAPANYCIIEKRTETVILSSFNLLKNNFPWFDSIRDLDLFLYFYNYKLITKSSYKSTPARSLALYKTLSHWNRYMSSESTAHLIIKYGSLVFFYPSCSNVIVGENLIISILPCKHLAIS